MDPRTIRIFISSPGDVAEERAKAQQVIAELARRYAGRLALRPILWEDLPLMADMSFQDGIEMVLNDQGGINVAVFILWSRLGSPLGKTIHRPDGSQYRSGTEREWDLMRAARTESLRHNPPKDARPRILAYVRNDEAGFTQSLQGKTGDAVTDAVLQRDFARQFVREQFYDAESGTNMGAYVAFGEPVTFAHRLRTHLRELLDGLLPEVAAPVWDRPPYQGLESFDVEHAAIFCGREREVCELDERFRARAVAGCPFVLLVGASGSGKSSLARAGWLHYMLHENLDASVQRWLPIVLTPGQARAVSPLPSGEGQGVRARGDLIALLAEGLAGALPGLSDNPGLAPLTSALRESPQQAWNLSIRPALHELDRQDRTRLVLLVDQLEELFTDPAITAAEADCFLRAVGLLVRTGQLWCLATVRSDFYDRCLLTPTLVDLMGSDGQFNLLPPEAGALHRIITLPATFAGLRFEAARGQVGVPALAGVVGPSPPKGGTPAQSPTGETLDARILAETAKNPEALPLLEYLLRELYEGRSADGRLTLAKYEELGGVEGALRSRAEKVFLEFARGNSARQAALGELLNVLVTMADGEEAVPVRRRARLDELPNGPCRELVRMLVEERLLVSDRGQISVAHEALLRRWERAAAWIAENREALRIRARVSLAFGRWKAEGEDESLLLPPGKPLAEALALLTTGPGMFGSDLQEYIRRSQQRQVRLEGRKRRGLQITAAVFASLALVAAAAAVFSLVEWRAAQKNATAEIAAKNLAEENASATRRQLALSYIAQGVDILDHGNDRAYGFAILGQAYKAAVDADARDLRAAVCSLLGAWQDSFEHSEGNVIWERPKTQHPIVLAQRIAPYPIAFSSDGATLATMLDARRAMLWNVQDGKVVSGPKYDGSGEVRGMAFNPDGQKFVTLSEDKSINLWTLKTGKRVPGPELGRRVLAVSFGMDGTILMVVTDDMKLQIYCESTRAGPLGSAQWERKNSAIELTAPQREDREDDPKGSGTAEQLRSKAPDLPANGLSNSTTFDNDPLFSFDSCGTALATSRGTTTLLWNALAGKSKPLASPTVITAIAISKSASIVAVAREGGLVRVYNSASSKRQGEPIKFDTDVTKLALSLDGTKLAVADGKTARVFDTATGKPLGSPLTHPDSVTALAFSLDASKLATACNDRAARIWALPSTLPDDPRLIGAYIERITLWAAAPDSELRRLAANTKPIDAAGTTSVLITTESGPTTYSGSIAGNGTLVKAGSGSLDLTSSSAWTGGFILD